MSTIEAGNAEAFDAVSSEALNLVGIPGAAAVPCMTIPWQIAQKLHTCSATLPPPMANDRAHDLVDLQLLEALLGDGDLAQTRSACVAVFEARAEHAWPPPLQVHPHWSAIYDRACEGLDHLGLAGSVEVAALRVNDFVRRINAATVTAR